MNQKSLIFVFLIIISSLIFISCSGGGLQGRLSLRSEEGLGDGSRSENENENENEERSIVSESEREVESEYGFGASEDEQLGYLEVKLSAFSPSGSKTVGPMNDYLATFDVCVKDGLAKIGGMSFLFWGGEGDLNLNLPHNLTVLKDDILVEGTEKYVDSYIFKVPEILQKDTCSSFTLTAVTANLIIAQPGVDDLLTVQLGRILDENEQSISLDNVPLSANTLKF